MPSEFLQFCFKQDNCFPEAWEWLKRKLGICNSISKNLFYFFQLGFLETFQISGKLHPPTFLSQLFLRHLHRHWTDPSNRHLRRGDRVIPI